MTRRVVISIAVLCSVEIVGGQSTRVSSPTISADHRVTFQLAAPSASEVLVSGEFMEGTRKLEKDNDGVWTITIGPLAPEVYHYNLIVDGVRTIDPGNPEVKTGSTASTLSSVLDVPGDSARFFDPRDVPHGEIRSNWYQSKTLNRLRRLTVYLPPDYERDLQSRYPVVYLFHGANADDTAWYRLGRVNVILDNLIAAKTITPFIVVMPLGYGVPPDAPSRPGENTQQFGADLIADVIPFVEARYRVLADREHRAIVGLSMGGGQALTLGLNHLERFSYIAGFSSGLGNVADFPKTYASVVAHPQTVNQKLRLLWVGCGREDGAFGASKSFSEFLAASGVKHTFRETDGAHTWMVWRRYLRDIAPLLFQPV